MINQNDMIGITLFTLFYISNNQRGRFNQTQRVIRFKQFSRPLWDTLRPGYTCSYLTRIYSITLQFKIAFSTPEVTFLCLIISFLHYLFHSTDFTAFLRRRSVMYVGLRGSLPPNKRTHHF